MKKTVLYIIISLLYLNCFGQKEINNPDSTKLNTQAITINFGATWVYNSVFVNYETKDFLKKNLKHDLKISTGFGFWNASVISKNTGAMFNAQVNYIRGAKKHHFEADGGVSIYLDKGVEPKAISYIGVIPRIFIGYRYQKPSGGFLFKSGIGGLEVLQIAVGYSW